MIAEQTALDTCDPSLDCCFGRAHAARQGQNEYEHDRKQFDSHVTPSCLRPEPQTLRVCLRIPIAPIRRRGERTDTVFQIGVAPRRIDIITGATGLDYDLASRNAMKITIEGIDLKVLSLDDLITNKESTGREKDRMDAAELKKLKGKGR